MGTRSSRSRTMAKCSLQRRFGTPGANAIAFYSMGDGVFVSAAITGDSSATAVANLVLKASAAGQ